MPRQVGRAQKKKGGGALNITSMMDMFTIILLFLLKSFSTGGVTLANAEGLALPNSISTLKPDKVNLQLAVTPDSIMLDNVPIESTERFRSIEQGEFDTDTNTVLDRRLSDPGALSRCRDRSIVRVDAGLFPWLDCRRLLDLARRANDDVHLERGRSCTRDVRSGGMF